MKNFIKFTVLFCLIFAVTTTKAQVLFSDDFESYNVGPFLHNTNGWQVLGSYNDIRIVSEPNRGNVLAWGWNATPQNPFSIASCIQKGILREFENHDPGNDVLKLEFEFWCKDFTGNFAELFDSNVGFESSDYYFKCEVNANESMINSRSTHPANYKKRYNYTWIKVEVYLEYFEITDSWEIHTYIPMLKYWGIQKRTTLGYPDLYIGFGVYKPITSYSGTLIKYDNIKLSAVPNRPTFANVNEWISSKFNVYPNPATNIVNITNSENVLVNQITIYDVTGKQVSTQNYNNETQLQLNVENLASGTYMLHLETNEGMAVKKLVKK